VPASVGAGGATVFPTLTLATVTFGDALIDVVGNVILMVEVINDVVEEAVGLVLLVLDFVV